ncbi:MAG: helical backbone metal receptor [Anaerolineales bacterium]|nr:helical backbone metal receptor [Anaerolineales bacterium]
MEENIFFDPLIDFIPQRVVSLVPSLTESLFDLGLGKSLVGATDYCAHPAESLKGIPRVGGTLNPRLEDIIALRPDLVLANQEENSPETLHALQSAGLMLWVTFPTTVAQAIEVLFGLVNIFRSDEAGRRVRILQMSLDWVQLASSNSPGLRTFCPIWQGETPEGERWWMTFNQDTYAGDLLTLAGGRNIFANRWEHATPQAISTAKNWGSRTAEAGKVRYPSVTLEEIRLAMPELVLLPSEPYTFSEDHRRELRELLADTPAGRQDRFHLVDGSLLTWHGTRLGQALKELPPLFAVEI